MVNAYEATGSYRAAAELCGTTHKTVKRVLARRAAGAELGRQSVARPKSTDCVGELIERRVRATDGRISAKRLLPEVRAAGFTGSSRSLRRAVAAAKAQWRVRRRVYRPWTPQPGQHLLIDYGLVTSGPNRGLHVFCAVLAWSRWRFVRFTWDETLATTLRLLAECFEAAGAVPAVVLSDRMGCLKGGVVANVVVPSPDYVRFAASWRFRPDFCEAADPESKGAVEALVRYANSDLIVPAEDWAGDLAAANAAARVWCTEVNAAIHTEIQAVPAQRLEVERPAMRPLPGLRPALVEGEPRKVDKMATIRFGSARYSVPHRLVGATVLVAAFDEKVRVSTAGEVVCEHPLQPPGGSSISDEHYPSPARTPRRPVRPRSAAETAFLALGASAEAFLRAAAAAGTPRLAGQLAELVDLDAAHGRVELLAALERAVEFRRLSADGVRAVLDAGTLLPQPRTAGSPLAPDSGFPAVPTRSLDAYCLDQHKEPS